MPSFTFINTFLPSRTPRTRPSLRSFFDTRRALNPKPPTITRRVSWLDTSYSGGGHNNHNNNVWNGKRPIESVSCLSKSSTDKYNHSNNHSSERNGIGLPEDVISEMAQERSPPTQYKEEEEEEQKEEEQQQQQLVSQGQEWTAPVAPSVKTINKSLAERALPVARAILQVKSQWRSRMHSFGTSSSSIFQSCDDHLTLSAALAQQTVDDLQAYVILKQLPIPVFLLEEDEMDIQGALSATAKTKLKMDLVLGIMSHTLLQFELVELDQARNNNNSSSSSSSSSTNSSTTNLNTTREGFTEQQMWRAIHIYASGNAHDTYKDPNTGYTVFTQFAHIKRGNCCGIKKDKHHNGNLLRTHTCRHCPYDAHDGSLPSSKPLLKVLAENWNQVVLLNHLLTDHSPRNPSSSLGPDSSSIPSSVQTAFIPTDQETLPTRQASQRRNGEAAVVTAVQCAHCTDTKLVVCQQCRGFTRLVSPYTMTCPQCKGEGQHPCHGCTDWVAPAKKSFFD